MVRMRLNVSSAEAKAELARRRGAAGRALDRFRNIGGQHVRGVMVSVIRERQKAGKGTLSSSVQWWPTRGGFFVGPTAAHAPFVDRPTRPHVIRPLHGKALAFPRAGGVLTRSQATGHVRTRFTFGGRAATTSAVFVAKVNHPGTAGMDFTGETARRVAPGLTAILADAVAAQLGAS